MSKPVLFVSMRPLEVSPDIEAIYHAYNGRGQKDQTDGLA